MRNPTNSSLAVRFFGLTVFLFAATVSWAQEPGVWTIGSPEGGEVRAVVYDDNTPGLVYVATSTNGVFRSHDGGATWEAANSGGTLLTGDLEIASDGTLFAGARVNSPSVAKSTDGGDSWTVCDSGLEGVEPIGMLALEDDDTLYLATEESGIFKSDDGCGTWTPAGEIAGYYSPLALEVDPTTPETVYVVNRAAALDEYLVKSFDGGESWQVESGLTTRIRGLAVNPADGSLLAPHQHGLLRSTDGGESWTELLSEGSGWAAIGPVRGDGTQLAFAGQQQFGSTPPFLMRSFDGGASWEEIVPDGGRVYETPVVAFDPFSETSVAFGNIGGPWFSADEGLSWTMSSAGLEAYYALSVQVDPETGQSVYSLNSTGDGVWKSDDGGQGWTLRGEEEFSGVLEVNPAPSEPDTLHVTDYRAILRSDDAGETWQEVSDYGDFGLLGPEVEVLAVDPTDSNVVLAGNASYDLKIFGLPFSPLVLRSTNAGVDWEHLYTPPDDGYEVYVPYALEIDPNDTNRYFVGVWIDEGVDVLGPYHQSVMRSTDGGEEWDEVLQVEGREVYPYAIRVDPTGSDVVYALMRRIDYVDPSFLFRSDDGGDTWAELTPLFPADYPCERGLRDIEVDPLVSGTVYASCLLPYISRDYGETWTTIGIATFPPVYAVYDLAVPRAVPRLLRVGTAGGIWSYGFLPEIELGGSCPGVVSIDVYDVHAGGEAALLRGEGPGTTVVPAGPCAGTELGLRNAAPLLLLTGDDAGRATLSLNLSGPACGQGLQVLDLTDCRVGGVARVPVATGE